MKTRKTLNRIVRKENEKKQWWNFGLKQAAAMTAVAFALDKVVNKKFGTKDMNSTALTAGYAGVVLLLKPLALKQFDKKINKLTKKYKEEYNKQYK